MTDTIAAIATPAGPGGIGVIRVSGPQALVIAEAFLGKRPKPRYAHRCRFRDENSESIDDGLLLAFPGPKSFTGEDVVELQAHGSPIALALLLARCIELGARSARPGEFSERAFLNDKLDLAQAEAIADLIASSSATAARAAMRSLSGEFSARVQDLSRQLIELRVYIEAAIDFPEEEIDFLNTSEVRARFAAVDLTLHELLAGARHGQRLRDGLHLVILGAPNAGKSSLLNALAGHESAIVTPIPGTTRDLLREHLSIDGMPITLVDTAGLRASEDPVEIEGIRRATVEAARADLVLWVQDASASPDALAVVGPDLVRTLLLPSDEKERSEAALEHPALAALSHPCAAKVRTHELLSLPAIHIHNKIDLIGTEARVERRSDGTHIHLSARTGAGVELLRQALREHAGLSEGSAGLFSARARHVDALLRTQDELASARRQALDAGHGELAAEDLRRAHEHLGEILGRYSSDALLGAIFSSFCIGK